MRNFYRHQDAAKSRSLRFVLLLSLSLLGTIVFTALAILVIVCIVWYLILEEGADVATSFPVELILYWYGAIAIFTGISIITVSYWKLKELRGNGGALLAAQLGGELLSPERVRQNQNWKRAFHVVEEMAIASRIPAPPVYILTNESGINAFAAGFEITDAVIGLTQGCVEKLDREQLQGVVAHEFSHIFNGDMRINLELLGTLHGVLGIPMTAEWLIQIGCEMSIPGYGGGAESINPIGPLLLLAGAMIWPVGMIGLFFAMVLKAAISRQREFLADASAVEFTRNPQGIGDALKVILGYKKGSTVRSSVAVEASHMFFANACRGIASLLDSHPPARKRILRIDPTWDGIPVFAEEVDIASIPFAGTMNFVGDSQASPQETTVSKSASSAIDKLVDPSRVRSLAYADEILASLPSGLSEVVKDSLGAEITFFALWVATFDEQLESQISLMDPEWQVPLRELLPHILDLQLSARLILLDVASRILEEQESSTLQPFAENAGRLMESHPNDSTFRWTWKQIAQWRILNREHRERKPRFGVLDEVLGPCELLLSILTYAGTPGPMARYTFERAAQHISSQLVLREIEDCTLQTLDMALEVLADAAPCAIRSVFSACFSSLVADRDISEEEALLIRGICAHLNLPAPTLLPGQPLVAGI